MQATRLTRPTDRQLQACPSEEAANVAIELVSWVEAPLLPTIALLLPGEKAAMACTSWAIELPDPVAGGSVINVPPNASAERLKFAEV